MPVGSQKRIGTQMFISGQIFDNALTEKPPTAGLHQEDEGTVSYHGRPIEIKDRLNRFRTVDENIWNNPYRTTSHKIRAFFHAKDQEFKCKSSQKADIFYISQEALIDGYMNRDALEWWWDHQNPERPRRWNEKVDAQGCALRSPLKDQFAPRWAPSCKLQVCQQIMEAIS